MRLRVAIFVAVAVAAEATAVAAQPSSDLPSAREPAAALQRALDLLGTRRFADLATLIERQQRAASAGDPVEADRLGWTLEAFRLDSPAVPKLIQEWVDASGSGWAPLLARAVDQGKRARMARGGKWASETSESQFQAMGDLLNGARADCSKVLSLSPGVCPCHALLLDASRLEGGDAAPVVRHAIAECPLDYNVNAELVYGLTPRWGGSYEAMLAATAAARERGMSAAEVRNLEAYAPVDRASLLWLARKRDLAVATLDAAISESPAALLHQERAWYHYRLREPSLALRDANAALELSRGGLQFSMRRLTLLLVARAWALHQLGDLKGALADLTLALQLGPNDPSVVQLRKQIQPALPTTR